MISSLTARRAVAPAALLLFSIGCDAATSPPQARALGEIADSSVFVPTSGANPYFEVGEGGEVYVEVYTVALRVIEDVSTTVEPAEGSATISLWETHGRATFDRTFDYALHRVEIDLGAGETGIIRLRSSVDGREAVTTYEVRLR